MGRACCCPDGLLGESGPAGHEAWCRDSLNASWKNLPDRVFQKGVSLLRTRNRDNQGTESAVG